MEEQEYEKFYGKIWRAGAGSAIITIPDKIIKANNWQMGDAMVVLVKKHNISEE